MEKIKVLFLSDGFPNKSSLAGIFALDQAKALSNSISVDVAFAAIDLRSFLRKRKLGLKKYRYENIKVFEYAFPLGNVHRQIITSFSKYIFWFLYEKIIEDWGKPDIIHAHFGFFCGSAAAYVCKKYDIPFVLTEHSSRVNQDVLKESDKIFYKKVYNSCDALVCVSNALKTKLQYHIGVNPILIPNVVDVDIFKYNPIPHDVFNFVSTGNLISLKQMDKLIDAFYIAFRGDTRVKLTIFGDGYMYDELKYKIKKYDISTSVILQGRKERSFISNYYSQSDCFVLYSKSETFGVSYIEAMASGLPVIATRCGGPIDFVNSKNGLLIRHDDINALVVALKYMSRNYRKYSKTQISKECKRLYSKDALKDKLEQLYINVLTW